MALTRLSAVEPGLSRELRAGCIGDRGSNGGGGERRLRGSHEPEAGDVPVVRGDVGDPGGEVLGGYAWTVASIRDIDSCGPGRDDGPGPEPENFCSIS